jgi:hypothetical protein
MSIKITGKNRNNDDNQLPVDDKVIASFHRWIRDTLWPRIKYVNEKSFQKIPDIMNLCIEWLQIPADQQSFYTKSIKFHVRKKISDVRKHYRLCLKKKVKGKSTFIDYYIYQHITF